MTVEPNLQLLAADDYSINEADHARFREEHDRGMLPAHHPSLSFAVPAVDPDMVTSDRIKKVIVRLQEVSEGQRRHSRKGVRRRTLVGLAAPQIGEPYRIIMVDTKVLESRKRYGKLECFVNPEIIWRTRETAEGREGCFSAGPVWGLVRRPLAVKIKALTADGSEIERIFEGFTARVVCHEIDHLDGIRFPERIKNDKKRHWVHTQELTDYPDLIHHWERFCTQKRWEAYKLTGSGENPQATPHA
ncbi:MAG TPA: peptide deformylase [Candidatus Saccharimonadales bacterium]|jgi:peptide deformylase|nr:peptide deformylase [Candidatus Saccharimonadales bacterium]